MSKIKGITSGWGSWDWYWCDIVHTFWVGWEKLKKKWRWRVGYGYCTVGWANWTGSSPWYGGGHKRGRHESIGMASAEWDWGPMEEDQMGWGYWNVYWVHGVRFGGPAIFLTLISSPEYNILSWTLPLWSTSCYNCPVLRPKSSSCCSITIPCSWPRYCIIYTLVAI